MLIKPRREDHRLIGFYLGTVLSGVGLAMFIPLGTAWIFQEWQPFCDYLLGAALTLSLGFLLRILCFTRKEPGWLHGLAVVALSWLCAAAVSALPLYLSGSFGSYLDAFFEAMNAFTTTGFSLARDLDHLAYAHNMWRHLMMFLGGQGIVVIALSVLIKSGAGGFRLYSGEGREERILPNVLNTSRFIWLVSSLFMLIGTAALTLILKSAGLSWARAFLHGLWLFMSGFDTGGFTPQSQSILYYHSWRLETALLFVILLGGLNFHLHHAVLSGRKKELWRNIELRTLAFSFFLAGFLVFFTLAKKQVYSGLSALFRKGVFLLVSAHTTTGYTTLAAGRLWQEWEPLAVLGLLMAMGIGASICSTSGGLKIFRLSIIGQALRQDIKRLLLPDSAVLAERFHHIKDVFLNDRIARSAALIALLYLATFFIGAAAGVAYGFPFYAALFESVAVASNSGLSSGIISAALPAGLKLVYILEAWAGRLEFTAVLGLLAYGWSCWRGK
ncbi:MAG: TrkH family potassium uptake protein [Candidatus Margulisbacteria bacterium]|jgi:trk system potassium uptake protein TrkH|nr:TrkH family potassium uptake protein [Candidatus Margulisiibacteriota bacterium]